MSKLAIDPLTPANSSHPSVVLQFPAFAPISKWTEISGMTRSATYLELAAGRLHAIKQPGGRRTMIDVQAGLAWLRSQPAAKFRAPKRAA